MSIYEAVYLASLVTFTFGALTFAVLTAVYFQQRRARGSLVFPAFTLGCAAAFFLNLAARAAAMSAWSGVWELALDVATALLPSLMLHELHEENRVRARWPLLAFYAASLLVAVAHWAEWWTDSPAILFGAAGAAGLVFERRPAARGHKLAKRVVLVLMVLAAAATLTAPHPILNLVPDYLLLAFFWVTLYYRERLVFFDLLIKRGAFFATGLTALTVFFTLTLPPSPDWTRPWVFALILMPLWLAGPWIHARFSSAIDRLWLGRQYSNAEAERHFAAEVQPAITEADLQARAAASLGRIFRTRADVGFDGAAKAEDDGLSAGAIALAPRGNGIPFLSDEHRLLASLSRTLDVLRENVRFREQQEALRLLASRAELKALRAQINPHFLFNALNAIAGLIHEKPELADETVEHLAQVFRYTLRKSENEWVRLDEEVEFATAYLQVEQARFGERLQVRFDVQPAAAMRIIPAMCIQPLVENAVKHGVSTVEGRGTVEVRAHVAGTVLMVEVMDNGPGFPAGLVLEPAGGHGLRNIAERLKGYYGEEAGLSWESVAGRTLVRLRIPG